MTDLKSLARLACDTVGERLTPEEERRLTYDESPAHVQEYWQRVVRVVVEGMREPSEAVVWAHELPHVGPDEVKACWQDMLTALLNEKD